LAAFLFREVRVTLDDCKALLPTPQEWYLEDQILDTITGGNTLLLRTAGEEAARWLFAALVRCRATVAEWTDDEREILRAAVHKRAVYELYSRSEVEASANDRRADATALLVALLGDCARGSQTAEAGTRSHHVGASAARDPRRPEPGASPLDRWDWGRRNA
jgi:hypothetical protein